MNGITNSTSINTALLQTIGEQVSETSKSEKNDKTTEVATNKPTLQNLGQNQVSSNDLDGVKQQVSINELASGTPTLNNPNQQASEDVAAGRGGKLFGEMTGTSMILELMLETLKTGNEARQLQRQVSTTKQNISIQEGMNQVDKMMQSADKTRMGAISQGVIGAAGTGISLGGLAGMNKGISNSLSGKIGGNPAKEMKIQNKLNDTKMQQSQLELKSLRSQFKGGSQSLTNEDKAKLNKLKAKAEGLQNKLDAIKDPTSAAAKAMQQQKSDNIKAAMEVFSGNVNTVNSTLKTGLEADAATLNAKGQLDSIRSETARTDRSKAEANYENSKSAITAMMRVMSEILQSLNSASSAAARA